MLLDPRPPLRVDLTGDVLGDFGRVEALHDRKYRIPPRVIPYDPMRGLLAAFLGACPEDSGWSSLDPDALEAALVRATDTAGVRGEAALEFAQGVGHRMPTRADLEALEALHVADLALSMQAARGVSSAIAAIEEAHADAVRRGLADATAVERDEVLQELREKLYVGPPPRIEAYRGRGPLRGWLKVAAKRVWLDRKKAAARRSVKEDAGLLVTIDGDAELRFLREHYAREVTAALETALQSLETKERNMLRQHFLHGLTIGQVAKLNDVHRSTVHRWMNDLAAALRKRVRAELCDRLGVNDGDLSTIVRVVRSRVRLPV